MLSAGYLDAICEARLKAAASTAGALYSLLHFRFWYPHTVLQPEACCIAAHSKYRHIVNHMTQTLLAVMETVGVAQPYRHECFRLVYTSWLVDDEDVRERLAMVTGPMYGGAQHYVHDVRNVAVFVLYVNLSSLCYVQTCHSCFDAPVRTV